MSRSSLVLALLLLSCGKTDAPKKRRKRQSVSVRSPKEYQHKVKAFFKRMKHGELGKAVVVFHKSLQGKLPLPKLQKLWGDVQKSAGDYKGVTSIVKKRWAHYVVYTVRCAFTKRPWEFVLTFNHKGEMIDLVNRPVPKGHP